MSVEQLQFEATARVITRGLYYQLHQGVIRISTYIQQIYQDGSAIL